MGVVNAPCLRSFSRAPSLCYSVWLFVSHRAATYRRRKGVTEINMHSTSPVYLLLFFYLIAPPRRFRVSHLSRKEKKKKGRVESPTITAIDYSLSLHHNLDGRSQTQNDKINKRDKKKVSGQKKASWSLSCKTNKQKIRWEVVSCRSRKWRGEPRLPVNEDDPHTGWKFHAFQLCASLCYLSLPAILCVFTSTSQQCACVCSWRRVCYAVNVFFFEHCSVPVPTTPTERHGPPKVWWYKQCSSAVWKGGDSILLYLTPTL